MSIKSLLLNENPVVQSIALFGTQMTARAVSVSQQLDYITVVTNESTTEKEKALAAADLVLRSLCKPDGSAYPADELPTAEELLACRSNAELIEAVNRLHRMSNGTLEAAEKN